MPIKSVKDLIALAKAKPGELNVATSGIATSTHLAAELFMYLTGTKMVTVPYKGGSPSMTAMLAGESQVNFAAMSRPREGVSRPSISSDAMKAR